MSEPVIKRHPELPNWWVVVIEGFYRAAFPTIELAAEYIAMLEQRSATPAPQSHP